VTPEAFRTSSYVALEAYNAWFQFEREFYLSCAYLRPKRTGGARVHHASATVTDEASAIRYAIPIVKGSGAKIPPAGQPIRPADEPDWSRRDVLVKLAADLSNEAQILSALSLQTTFFDDLPTIRIFYAHRARSTADKVRRLALRRYGVPYLSHAHILVSTILPQRANTLLVEWLADMQLISSALCH
jgi:hypothetical protein